MRGPRVRWLLAVTLALASLGCASAPGWVGHDIDEVIAALGEPTRVEPERNGIRVFVWATEVRIPHSRWSNEGGKPRVVTTYTVMRTRRIFYVDASGTVVAQSREE